MDKEITEDYVGFYTAQLLNKEGFDVPTATSFDKDGNIKDSMSPFLPDDGDIRRPTLQMAMKWLREVQGINIYARAVWKDVEVQYGDWEPAVVGYNWFVESLLDDTYSKMSIEPFLTYEQAAESAIMYCLENLV